MFVENFRRTETIRLYGNLLPTKPAALKGQTSHVDLTGIGLKVVNGYLFPSGRSWLKALGG